MKNYLFFPKNYSNWKLNFQDINNKVDELNAYINLFLPSYKQIQNKAVTPSEGNSTIIKGAKMLAHDFLYITRENTFLQLKDSSLITLPLGNILVSNARNEGDSEEVEEIKNYFLQPLGWATFYLWRSKSYSLSAEYLTNTGEISSLNYSFYFAPWNFRWIYSALIDNQYTHILGTNILGSVLNDNDYIDTNYKINWTDFDNPPMSFFFNTNLGEEIIADYSFTTEISKRPEGNEYIYSLVFPDYNEEVNSPTGDNGFKITHFLI